jgi:hypothetical protein
MVLSLLKLCLVWVLTFLKNKLGSISNHVNVPPPKKKKNSAATAWLLIKFDLVAIA